MRADLQAITIVRCPSTPAGRAAGPVIVMGLGSGMEWWR
jgi:hypothetical protein